MRKVTTCLIAAALPALGTAAAAWPGCEEDILAAAAHGDTLSVRHERAAYNCCMDGTEYSVLQDAARIEIRETEIVTDPCACLCCYDLGVEVRGLAPGEYALVFLWYDVDVGGWREWTEDVTVSGSGTQPWVAEVSNSGCLAPPSAVDPGMARVGWGRVKAFYQ